MPKLFCYGIQRLTLLKDALVLAGAGVGGGSLVYANTLLVPPDEVFDDAAVEGPRRLEAPCSSPTTRPPSRCSASSRPGHFVESDQLLQE